MLEKFLDFWFVYWPILLVTTLVNSLIAKRFLKIKSKAVWTAFKFTSVLSGRGLLKGFELQGTKWGRSHHLRPRWTIQNKTLKSTIATIKMAFHAAVCHGYSWQCIKMKRNRFFVALHWCRIKGYECTAIILAHIEHYIILFSSRIDIRCSWLLNAYLFPMIHLAGLTKMACRDVNTFSRDIVHE